MRQIMELHAPEKLRFSTLEDVFSAFWTVFDPKHFKKPPAYKHSTYFWYDESQWISTFRKEQSTYQRYNWPGAKTVVFTNIKLPNDSYIYTSQYGGTPPLVNPSEPEPFTFLKKIIGKLNDLHICEVEGILDCKSQKDYEKRVEMKYWEARQRFDIYLWSSDETKCITIKFEYGYSVNVKPAPDSARRDEFNAFISNFQ